MNKDIMICGVGGQGTVLASKITAAAAMEEKNRVHSAETIGMAQRGGSVTSHVRIGEDAYSPLIPLKSADLLLAFEPSEAVRNLKYLKNDGLAIVNTVPAKPVTDSLIKSSYDPDSMISYLKQKCECIFVDSNKICAPFGSSKFFNIIILGIASSTGKLGISKDTILSQIEKQIKQKYIEANKKAFLSGYEFGIKYISEAENEDK